MLRRLPIASVFILLCACASARLRAQSLHTAHIRPDAMMRPVVDDAIRWSSVVRGLIDRLEQSDVTVYVRAVPGGAPPSFHGHIAFLTRIAPRRYLVIELPTNRNAFDQIGMLAHELRHAVEIADAPAIVDAATLIAHYERIGRRTSALNEPSTHFETRAAIETGREAGREAAESARRSADDQY